ncbi:MAG: hypothetical protein HYV07_06440 [Deltaproteobacteria bacterium]|nr:hypothetical protein [Deltaproteobacteria bacterium]
MKRIVVVGGLALLLAAGSCGDRYRENDLELVTAYRAKELCSCLFVMEQTEDFCVSWTAADPNVAKYAIDRNEKTVETSALLMWSAKARWVDERSGCVLE